MRSFLLFALTILIFAMAALPSCGKVDSQPPVAEPQITAEPDDAVDVSTDATPVDAAAAETETETD